MEEKKVTQEECLKHATEQEQAQCNPQTPEQPPSQEASKPPIPRQLKREAEIIAGEYRVECPRNLTEIIKALTTNETLKKLTGTDTEVTINLLFTDTIPGEPEKQTIGKGKYDDLVKNLPGNVLTPGGAVEMLRHFCIRMIETSNLKAAMFTLLFDEDKLGGLGIVNENVEILPEHITKFTTAVSGQLDLFKDAMRKKGFKFSDDSNIILPANFKPKK